MDTFGFDNGNDAVDTNAQYEGFSMDHFAGEDDFLNQDLDRILNGPTGRTPLGMGAFGSGNQFDPNGLSQYMGNGDPRMFEQSASYAQPGNFSLTPDMSSFPFPNMQQPVPANSGFEVSTHSHSLPQTSLSESIDDNSNSSGGSDEMPKPTRGRPKKNKANKPPSIEEQEKTRNRFLDRNRKAASKCRQRKKEWTNGLQEKQRNLIQQNAAMAEKIERMLAEKEAIMRFMSEHAPLCPPFKHMLDSVINNPAAVPMPQQMSRQGSGAVPMSQQMSRQDSGASTISQSSFGRNGGEQSMNQSVHRHNSVNDSGISDMGTPPNKGGEKGPDNSDDAGVKNMMPNPRITRQTRASGPAEFVDPGLFIRNMKAEAP